MILSLFSVLGFNAEAKESPRFSNDTEEHWYYLCFSNTGKVIQSNGNGKHMTSEQPDAANQAQKWKLVGTQTDFMLVNATDGSVYKDGTYRTSTDASKAISWQLVESNHDNCWMISDPTDEYGCINQYGDGSIGGWKSDANDGNNAIEFLSEMPVKDLPKFSSFESNYWYYMSFACDGSGITDNGNKKDLTGTAMRQSELSQQWKLIGSAGDFIIMSANGRYVCKNGAFQSTDSKESAVHFELLPSSVDGHWQVKYKGDDWGCMNLYGDKTVNGWYADASETHNAIRFIENANVLDLPEFSNGDTEHWYYISYANGGRVFTDNGDGKAMTHTTVEANNPAQIWKLTGDAENFHLISKLGNYVYKDGAFRTSANPDKAAALSLEKAGNPDFPHSLIINYRADGWGIMNPYGDGTINGYWNDPSDQNNALGFIDISKVAPRPDMSGIKEFEIAGTTTFTPKNRATLWYTNPATAEDVENPWMEYALPIGNGEFGGMIYGGVHCERIQFNDKSVWTGTSKRRGSYQNFGEVFIEDISGVFENSAVKDYVRYLDMSEGIAGVSYSDGSATYRREYLASYPDKAIAVRLSADKGGKISIRTRLLNNIKIGFVTPTYSNGCASFEGELDLISLKAAIKVIPTGGVMMTNSDNIEIRNADEVIIILAGATNFDQNEISYTYSSDAMKAEVDRRISSASSKDWTDIRDSHTADFGKYFGRVDFAIADAANHMNTKEMIDSYPSGSATASGALMLEELYFNYGRYLLISSSRGMDTPANLQGIWNNSDNPAWQSDIHSNINVQMNYWLAESTNLSEMHMPYLNYIYSMALKHNEWPSYARKVGQTKGWTCFTQNNIFGHSDYAENYVIANAWYTSHLWQHYLYTNDTEFLRDKALPVMVSCCEFWLERLKEAPDGTLVAPAEWSPEHGPAAEDGTAHAQQIIFDLFESTLKAIDILGPESGTETAFTDNLKAKFAKLDKGLAIETYTGKWGATCNGITSGTNILREWKYSDYSVGQNGHRHQSHLMAMYPFGQISPESEFFTPAVNSLALRSDESTGWSLVWKICLWARALDGEHAHRIIKNALHHSTSYAIEEKKGGIYYNLLDSHAPFQIDGNFGYSAGVAELLLQSHSGHLRLLPALPAAWKSGHIRGLRAVGNFEVDQYWQNNRLTKAVVKSESGQRCNIIYPAIGNATVNCSNGEPVEFVREGDNEISFDTEAPLSYTIVMADNSGIVGVNSNTIDVTILNGVIQTNTKDAYISVCDTNGRVLASATGASLDIRPFRGSILIVSVITRDDKYICKYIF